MDETVLAEAKKIVKRKKQFFQMSLAMIVASIALAVVGFITGEWVPFLLVISGYALTILVFYLVIWNKFGNLKTKSKRLESNAVAEEYFRLKKIKEDELSESEILELKELQLKKLEKRHDDRDFV